MSSFVLKIIAVITMMIDHIGYVFFPNVWILRLIGRFAMPIFAFQVALGFKHTSNRKKYIMRMLIFAIVSQIPFLLMCSIRTNEFKLNIGFTFLLALLLLYSLEEIKPIRGKIFSFILLLLVAVFLKYDYYLFGVFLVIMFYYLYQKPYYSIPAFVLGATIYTTYRSNIMIMYSLLALIPLAFYNGKKGKDIKYFFYVFYPLHMLIFYLIFTFCL